MFEEAIKVINIKESRSKYINQYFVVISEIDSQAIRKERLTGLDIFAVGHNQRIEWFNN